MATDYSALGPWAGAAAAGYDRAHADKLQRATQNALAGYGQDPDTAVKNFMAVDAPAAIGLQQQLAQQRAAMAAQQEESRKRALGAITGATDMLRKVRDSGGDVGSAYDHLDQGGILDTLGMSPQEKAQYRAAIVANPDLIDMIGQKAAEGVVLAQGAQLRDKNTGRLLGENPMALKPVTVGPGNTATYFDPNTGTYAAPGTSGGGAVPTTPGGGTSRGDRNGNPGNLKDGPFARSQPGYLGSDGTFAKFAPGAGVAAQENLLRSRYFARGLNTVNSIVDTYLGSGNDENSGASRQNYKSYVARKLGIDPNQPIPPNRLRDLGQAMREFETGNTGSAAQSSGRVASFTTPAAPTKAPEPPSGYKWSSDGSLAFIPGGPADPSVKGSSTGTPLTKTQVGAATQKLVTLKAIANQLDRVQRAYDVAKKNGYVGPVWGNVPFTGSLNNESGALDKSLSQIAPLITSLTRVPGIGSMSDYESKLANMGLPHRNDNEGSFTEGMTGFRQLLDQTIAGYQEMLGQSGAPAAGQPQASSAPPVRVRTVQQAMALPPGTVFITPDGRRKVR